MESDQKWVRAGVIATALSLISGIYSNYLQRQSIVAAHISADNGASAGIAANNQTVMNPHLAIIVLGYASPVVASLFLFATVWLAFRRPRLPSPGDGGSTKLEILTPLDHAEVGLRRTVSGSVSPPNTKVQVLVFAGDNMWYLQAAPQISGRHWTVECQFGNAGKPEGQFSVIAISGDRVRDRRIHTLPDDVARSPTIKVTRTHE